MFVSGDNDIAFFAVMNRYRNDLSVEFAFLLSFSSAHLAVVSAKVLIFTGYAETGSNVFSRYAHVVAVFCANEAVTKHGIFENAVAHTIAATSFSDYIRSVGHGFHTACYNDVSIAEFDLLSCQGYSTEAGTTKLVDRKSRYFLRNAGVESYLASCIFTAACCQYMTHDNFVDLVNRNFSTFNCCFNSYTAEFYSR